MLSDLKFSKRIVGQVFGPVQYLGLSSIWACSRMNKYSSRAGRNACSTENNNVDLKISLNFKKIVFIFIVFT